jgi:hypothetical protein
MTLEQLQARSGELQSSIMQTTNQVFVLQGHKNEVDYQIKLVQEATDALANQVEPPVV